MKWPWIARSAHDEVVAVVKDERDRLRDQVDTLMDQIVRLARREKGMSELTPEKRKDERITLPPAAIDLLNAWGSPATQAELRRRMVAMYRNTRDWQETIGYFRREIAEQLEEGVDGG